MSEQNRIAKRKIRERLTALKNRLFRAGQQHAYVVKNRNNSSRPVNDEVRRRAQIIEGMTNWQRNQMLKACKGDLSAIAAV